MSLIWKIKWQLESNSLPNMYLSTIKKWASSFGIQVCFCPLLVWFFCFLSKKRETKQKPSPLWFFLLFLLSPHHCLCCCVWITSWTGALQICFFCVRNVDLRQKKKIERKNLRKTISLSMFCLLTCFSCKLSRFWFVSYISFEIGTDRSRKIIFFSWFFLFLPIHYSFSHTL